MSKITSLTDEQKAKMPEYVKKWIDIGLSTAPTNRERAKELVKDYYSVAGLTPPSVVVFGQSPKQSMQYTNLMLLDNFDALKAKFGDMPLQEALPLMIKECSKKDLKKVNQWNSNFVGGNLWVDWQAFNDFFMNEVGVKGLEIINPTLKMSEKVGWIFPYNNFVVLTEKPIYIHRNAAGRLHFDGGKCIEWADGWGFYSLNGVRVSEYVACTEASKLDAKKILGIPNVDERREAVKKLGAANMIAQLGATVLDKKTIVPEAPKSRKLLGVEKSDNVFKLVQDMNVEAPAQSNTYELLSVNWTNSERRYLKMSNPSIDAVHIEAVHPSCETVDMALGFRNQDIFGNAWQDKKFTFVAPIVLS